MIEAESAANARDRCGLASALLPFTHRKTVNLHMGDVVASNEPLICRTLLGSCVAVCLYDPELRAGGMNHILLPECSGDRLDARCGHAAMELLIEKLIQMGGHPNRFVAKAFGGASLFEANSALPGMGTRNCAFVRHFLDTERIPLVGRRLGGNRAIQLTFETDTSRATVQLIREPASYPSKRQNACTDRSFPAVKTIGAS